MNKKMSIIAILVLAITISAYSVSGTYAKYTSDTTITDNARVAKWGVTFADKDGNTLDGGVENSVDLFASSYDSIDAAGKKDVQSSDASKVIAPGTSGEYKFQVTGSPEVNFELVFDTTGSEITSDSPELVTSLKGKLYFWLDDAAQEDGNKLTFDELLTKINALGNNEVYAAGKINEGDKQTHTINWKWDIGEEDADVTDTALGNATSLPKVTLKVKIIAKQSEKQATKKANGTALD